MGLFSKKNFGDNTVLIIDINDFSFEAAIFSRQRGAPYELVEFLEKGNLIHENLEATARNIEIQLERILRKIIDKAARAKKRIDFCFITFSPMWRISENHLVKIKKDAPFVFIKKDFDELLKSEDSAFFKNLKNTFNFERLKLIEADIMSVLLNGYPSETPFDKSVKTVELHIFISAVDKRLFDFINNILRVRLNLSFEEKTLFLKSGALISFASLKDFFPREGALLVNVGSETTEIIFIKNGRIEETAHFNKGTDFFVRRAVSELKISLNIAESYFTRFQNNLLEAGVREKFKNIISGATRDFKNHFFEAVSEISAGNFLPQDLFFLSLKSLPQDLFVFKNQNGDQIFNVHKISLSELFPEKEKFCYNNSSSSLCLPSVFLNKYLDYGTKQ